MNVITTFQERRYEKQIQFERKILRQLSLQGLKASVQTYFQPFFYSESVYLTAIEEGSVDMALEAYLLGASFSRFGYYGEPVELIRIRSKDEEKYLTDDLYNFLQCWELASGNDLKAESLYIACEQFMEYWWFEGFQKGEMRYRMRLH